MALISTVNFWLMEPVNQSELPWVPNPVSSMLQRDSGARPIEQCKQTYVESPYFQVLALLAAQLKIHPTTKTLTD